MNNNNHVVANFTDKFGESREIHNTRHGLKVKRKESTLILHLNPTVCAIIGRRISELRKKRGLTLEELCLRAGVVTT